MRHSLLLSLGACLVGVGLVHAQPARNVLNRPADERSKVPDTLSAPTNKLAERNGIRGFSEENDLRAPSSLGSDTRNLLSPASGRSYHGDGHNERRLAPEGTGRQVKDLTIQPGEKANRIAEAGSERHLATENSSRPSIPAVVLPDDRHVSGDR
jgi:hypothetical protein